MSELKEKYDIIIESMGVPNLEIPLTAVKFFRGDTSTSLLPKIERFKPEGITLTSCQALRQASLGDPVCLTRENIGCVAAAITFGLVDQNQTTPLEGSRVYTDIMKNQTETKNNFTSPSPKEFTDGMVYACKDANRPDFALFGKEDVGRYKDTHTAKQAIEEMMAIQDPADTKAVFFFSKDFNEVEIIPDIVVLSIRPVELTRIIQAYQYNTGKRINASMGGLRVVNSDLIVRPYLTGEINLSTYCLGARLIAKFEGNLMGIGLPWSEFEIVSQGMQDSKTGFPFHLYPDADNTEIN